jgi:hypothetical protein
MNIIPTWAQSSEDPSQISLSIQSFGKTLIGIVALVASLKGLNPQTATDQFQIIIDNAAAGTAAVFTVYHSLVTIYGLLRKAFYRFVAKPAAVEVPVVAPAETPTV